MQKEIGLEVAVKKMRQASSQVLVGCRGSLIQACLIFSGLAPTPSHLDAPTRNELFNTRLTNLFKQGAEG